MDNDNGNSSQTLLTALRESPKSTWSSQVSFNPTNESDPATDGNLTTRHRVLVALHSESQTRGQSVEDHPLLLYLLDEETRYHTKANHCLSSLSLASYLLSLYRRPHDIWAIWIARHSNFDASKCVDMHYIYYAGGGIEQTRRYVAEDAKFTDVVEGMASDDEPASERISWWEWMVNQSGDDEDAWVELKAHVLERIEMDKKYGMTDEKVSKFVEESWRKDTSRWEEVLYTE
ncbi:hypothetical protein DL96DRAFT_1572567 [Flagelloscypha sp. PMI_526]|nr:hypothetical protein DL96DRAFT_1572567 [Flagelloscypha sp. PMI_526]